MDKQCNINELKAFIGKCKRPVLDQLIRLADLPRNGYKLDLKIRLESYLDANPSEFVLKKLIRYKESGNISDLIPDKIPESDNTSKTTAINFLQKVSNHETDSINIPARNQFIRVPLASKTISFADYPFYKQMNTLQNPMILTPNYGCFNIGRNTYEKAINFNLTQDVAEAITYHLKMKSNTEVEFAIQVVLRFGLLDIPECERLEKNEDVTDKVDDLPVHLDILVNGRKVSLSPLLPCKKPGMDGRRDGRPINVTPHLRLSPFFRNLIQIFWSHNYDSFKYHYFGIYLMSKQSPNDLVDNLLDSPATFMTTELCKQRIVDSLAPKSTTIEFEDDDLCIVNPENEIDDDCIIPSSTLPVKILCPLTMSRVAIPARGKRCKHLQCFDAKTYLRINELKPRWTCPLCCEQTKYRDLIVDEYIYNIIRNERLPKQVDTIIFDTNGEWTFEDVAEESDENAQSESNLVCNDSVIKQEMTSNMPVTDNLLLSPTPLEVDNVPSTHFIDLTESDDEDCVATMVSNSRNPINQTRKQTFGDVRDHPQPPPKLSRLDSVYSQCHLTRNSHKDLEDLIDVLGKNKNYRPERTTRDAQIREFFKSLILKGSNSLDQEGPVSRSTQFLDSRPNDGATHKSDNVDEFRQLVDNRDAFFQGSQSNPLRIYDNADGKRGLLQQFFESIETNISNRRIRQSHESTASLTESNSLSNFSEFQMSSPKRKELQPESTNTSTFIPERGLHKSQFSSSNQDLLTDASDLMKNLKSPTRVLDMFSNKAQPSPQLCLDHQNPLISSSSSPTRPSMRNLISHLGSNFRPVDLTNYACSDSIQSQIDALPSRDSFPPKSQSGPSVYLDEALSVKSQFERMSDVFKPKNPPQSLNQL